jgi:hypothetical protein
VKSRKKALATRGQKHRHSDPLNWNEVICR